MPRMDESSINPRSRTEIARRRALSAKNVYSESKEEALTLVGKQRETLDHIKHISKTVFGSWKGDIAKLDDNMRAKGKEMVDLVESITDIMSDMTLANKKAEKAEKVGSKAIVEMSKAKTDN